jgi:hypothetical protein
VSKQYGPWTPEQAYLLPPSPKEWLPEGHLAYFDDDDDDGKPNAQPSLHRVQATPAGKPKPGAQRNVTDADSRIMIRSGAFMQAYNAQAAASEDQVIVAHGVTNDGTEVRHLAPKMERVHDHCGEPSGCGTRGIALADSGLASTAVAPFYARSALGRASLSLRYDDSSRISPSSATR